MGALVKLKETLDAENDDVRKLEGFSLASIYHTILSSKTEQLAKEREEVFQAKLAYDSCFAELAKLRCEKGEHRDDREQTIWCRQETWTLLFDLAWGNQPTQ